MSHILVVEDEHDLSFLITRNLEVEGHSVTSAADIRSAHQHIGDKPFDLVILDLMLPDGSGLDLLRQLRRNGNDVPVIILTARASVSDRVEGLKLGADDYVTKPFEMAELLARMEAVWRRAGDRGLPDTLDLGAIHVDFSRQVARRDHEEVPLSTREFRVLRVLASRPNHPVTRETLLKAAWDADEAVTMRTVDAHVKNLRKKIEPDPAHPTFIRTRHREGYMLVLAP